MDSTIARVATALLIDYSSVYYIDLQTGRYECYSTNPGYQRLELHSSGEDFFRDCQRDVLTVVFRDDQTMVSDALRRESLVQQLHEQDTLSIVYRLMIDGNPVYHTMRILRDPYDIEDSLILGVLNVDESVRAEQSTKVYNDIAKTLANQYDTIYYVDMLNDHYMEFSSTDTYKNLDVLLSGGDFFKESQMNIDRVIHPEDRDEMHRILDKPVMIGMLQGKHMITHTYRLSIGNTFMYARLSAIWATDNKHLIVGVMNIDKEIRREQEIEKKLSAANEKAYRDKMTGVKNKTAFTEYMENLQEKIRQEKIQAFSIVICDVNGLKKVNDSLGHIEGDLYIQSASQLICHTWEHSPVFRIGGDEFAVVLQGSDYQNRRALEQGFKEQVRENIQAGKVVVAVGMADYGEELQKTADAVFELADNRMYADKAALKGLN